MIAFLKNALEKIKNLFTKKASNGGSIHYMNSGESLPQPYTREEEEEKIILLLNGEQSVRKQLIEHNLRLVVYIARKFDNSGVELDDLISVGTIGLIKAVNTFNAEKKIKLATYASRCIENEILMYLRKVSKQKREVSLDEPLNCDAEGNELCICDTLSSGEDEVSKNMDKADESSNLFSVLNDLTSKEKEIMYMRYGLSGKEEMTQKEVADYFEISQSYISRIEKKILGKMKHKILKLA